jgi:hypothetical protein
MDHCEHLYASTAQKLYVATQHKKNNKTNRGGDRSQNRCENSFQHSKEHQRSATNCRKMLE